jgi:membrane fusion protein (multidrug efflux system)
VSAFARWMLFAVLAIGVAAGGYAYWRHGKLYPSTDDAYIEANVVRVAAQVSGPVTRVPVHDQEHVRAGQVLFEIDRRPFELALAHATARLQLATQGMGSDVAAVRAAEAEVQNQRVQLDKARTNAERTVNLQQQGFVSTQAHDDAIAAVNAAKAQLAVAQARLNQARINLGKIGDQNQRVREAQATRERAELDLAHTRITAACDGQIAELSLQPGSTARAGTPLFALVCTDKFWIGANFKETQLERIKPGQPVDIRLDMYPGQHFEGRVETISPASGVAFSLLPPQNATGNWVKVTQRVPVRIAVSTLGPSYPLRVGTSATVTVDTTADTKTVANSD